MGTLMVDQFFADFFIVAKLLLEYCLVS